MKVTTKYNGWQDFLELCLASWVFVSPFVLGFFDNVSASLSCMFIGGLIISTSIFGMARETPGLEWATLCLSICLMVTPWLFSYAHISIAVLSVLISGGALVVFSILAMVHEYRERDLRQRTETPSGQPT